MTQPVDPTVTHHDNATMPSSAAPNPSHAAGPLRILNVITDTDRRGAQVFACDLGEELALRGHHVSTVALVPGTQHGGLDVTTLGRRARSPLTVWRLSRLMRRSDATIAHGSSTGLACALSGQRFIYRQISDSRFWARTAARRLRVAAYLRRADQIVTLSDAAASTMHEHLWLSRDRMVTIPNAVPKNRFLRASPVERQDSRARLGLGQQAFVVMFAGALVPEKGAALAIRSVAETGAAQLLVVGSGPERLALEGLSDQLAPGRVTFVGAQSDMQAMYAAADVLVLPSMGGDSMPAVLIEAGLMGIPCVSTPVGAIGDVLVNGITGLLVEIGDQEGLTSALKRLIESPQLRHQLGSNAESLCSERFEIRPVADQWERVLSTSTGNDPTSAGT